jgi:hypothetical protein
MKRVLRFVAKFTIFFPFLVLASGVVGLMLLFDFLFLDTDSADYEDMMSFHKGTLHGIWSI